jgi:hypothetical protein
VTFCKYLALYNLHVGMWPLDWDISVIYRCLCLLQRAPHVISLLDPLTSLNETLDFDSFEFTSHNRR